tara:strand:+ start:1073 stop:1264 length:192 start_codon:yes stop_codon:yes gene_type:complete
LDQAPYFFAVTVPGLRGCERVTFKFCYQRVVDEYVFLAYSPSASFCYLDVVQTTSDESLSFVE